MIAFIILFALLPTGNVSYIGPTLLPSMEVCELYASQFHAHPEKPKLPPR